MINKDLIEVLVVNKEVYELAKLILEKSKQFSEEDLRSMSDTLRIYRDIVEYVENICTRCGNQVDPAGESVCCWEPSNIITCTKCRTEHLKWAECHGCSVKGGTIETDFDGQFYISPSRYNFTDPDDGPNS